MRGVGRAAQLIDLTRQTGVHPRIGAADVVPFVPVSGISLAECAMLARQAGLEIWRRFGVPVYFYEAAAVRPDRVNLEDVRRGQFEGLRETCALGRGASAGCRRSGDASHGRGECGGCAAIFDRLQHLPRVSQGRPGRQWTSPGCAGGHCGGAGDCASHSSVCGRDARGEGDWRQRERTGAGEHEYHGFPCDADGGRSMGRCGNWRETTGWWRLRAS